uniref:Uncharacterized protein n=1 Tax=Arundo donax TaxID=35708 RepID=A0A0A9EAN8_ARUDO
MQPSSPNIFPPFPSLLQSCTRLKRSPLPSKAR